MSENSEFLADINPCDAHDELILTLKENNDRKHDHKFNYEPIDSIRNQVPDSICINSFNKIIYHKKIIGVDTLEAVGDDDDDNDENNATFIKIGENDVSIPATKHIELRIKYCSKEPTKILELSNICSKEIENTHSRKEGDELGSTNMVILSSCSLFLLLIIIGIVVFLAKKMTQQKESKASVTNNPLYGIDYDDYYAETRMEESNPHYDAYYKDDYATNITDDNKMYGEEDGHKNEKLL